MQFDPEGVREITWQGVTDEEYKKTDFYNDETEDGNYLNKCNPLRYNMDRGQTYDVVDTPPPDRRCWPALEDF
jgi:hypothetical protein